MMSEPLQTLVNIESFTALQDKMTKWLQNYQINSADQNVTRCCEVIELNSKIQSQLFRILGLTVSEGCPHEGANIIRKRVLPRFTQDLLMGTGPISSEKYKCVDFMNDDIVTDQEMTRLQQSYRKALQDLERDLRITSFEADHLQDQLEETRDELNSLKHQTSNEKNVREMAVQEMHQKLRLLDNELAVMKFPGSSSKLCDSEIRTWKEDFARRTCRNEHPVECFQRLRQEHLIQRFLEMYSIDRQSAMNSLGTTESTEDRQKILFDVLQEAFTAAKMAFASYKTRVRSTIILKHSGSPSLEEAVQDYIIRHPDDYNLTGLVLDVTRAVRQRRPSHSKNTVLNLIQPFIREACRLAWNMQALPVPIDIAPAVTCEFYDNQRYRRYYSSECTAPLVEHHVWPSLVQGLKVIVKGEAYTERTSASATDFVSRSTL